MRTTTNVMIPFIPDPTPPLFPSPPAWGRGLPASGGAEGDQGRGEGRVESPCPLVFRGPVAVASAPAVQGAQRHLALVLLRILEPFEALWKAPADENGLTLRKSALGGPCLFVEEKAGPSLSFSHGNGRLWAAMSDRGSVGIDVAYPEEFSGAYPFGRAFNAEEMASARALCPGDMARGAALMWGVKEAAVKATGAGFNFFDPLEVRVGPPLVREEGVLFEVLVDRPVSAWVMTEGRGWLSVALA
jgi:phosphopantetheinyl transferase